MRNRKKRIAYSFLTVFSNVLKKHTNNSGKRHLDTGYLTILLIIVILFLYNKEIRKINKIIKL